MLFLADPLATLAVLTMLSAAVARWKRAVVNQIRSIEHNAAEQLRSTNLLAVYKAHSHMPADLRHVFEPTIEEADDLEDLYGQGGDFFRRSSYSVRQWDDGWCKRVQVLNRSLGDTDLSLIASVANSQLQNPRRPDLAPLATGCGPNSTVGSKS